eukprot:365583-Chlamydomonas_euryale.AAC.6
MQVQDYCRTCSRCQATKSTSQRQLGLHQPLAVPEDWPVGLHGFYRGAIRGHAAILVIVDRLT